MVTYKSSAVYVHGYVGYMHMHVNTSLEIVARCYNIQRKAKGVYRLSPLCLDRQLSSTVSSGPSQR